MIGAFIATLGLFTIAIAAPTYSNGTSSVDCSKTESIIASFPHPSNCSKYFQCSNGTKVEVTCPANQHYNSALRTCDDPKYAACKINASSSNPSMPPLLHLTVEPTDSNQTQLAILNPTPVYPRSTTVPGKLENVTLHATDDASVNSSNVLSSGTTSGPNLTSTPSEFTTNKSGDVSTPASLNRSTNISSNASLGQVNQTAAKSSEESTPSSATVKPLRKVNVESGQDIRVKDNKNEEKNNSEEEKGDETESEDAESNDKSEKSATTTS